MYLPPSGEQNLGDPASHDMGKGHEDSGGEPRSRSYSSVILGVPASLGNEAPEIPTNEGETPPEASVATQDITPVPESPQVPIPEDSTTHQLDSGGGPDPDGDKPEEGAPENPVSSLKGHPWAS